MKFKNLGPVKSGEVIHSDFTIFWGNNNTGKTFMSYALYSIFKKMSTTRFDKAIKYKPYVDD